MECNRKAILPCTGVEIETVRITLSSTRLPTHLKVHVCIRRWRHKSKRTKNSTQKVQSISEHWARSDCLNFMQRDKFIGKHNYNCVPCSSAGNKHDFLHLFVVEEVIEWPDTFVLAKWVGHQVRVVTESRKAFINKQQLWVGKFTES